mgnify:CR=1 FL=1
MYKRQAIGGFIAHYVLAHTIHDLFHYEIEPRITLSKTTLKILLVISLIILLAIALYLTYECGWPVMVFAIIGAIACMYAEGLIHHESQMAIGAMFLVIGSFYVQMGYSMNGNVAEVFKETKAWLECILLSLFAFFSQYGWLLFYRLDDYGWSTKKRNESILITKIGLIFLINKSYNFKTARYNEKNRNGSGFGKTSITCMRKRLQRNR